MKPFQLILIAIFVIFAVVGLIVFAGANPGNNKNAIGDVVIWGTLPKEDVNQALDAIRRIRTDFDGVTYTEVSFDEFHTTYTEALAVDRGPDMILIPHELLLAEWETLAPISFDAYKLRDFQDAYIDAATIVVDDAYIGVPVGVDPLITYYNRNILNRARISEAPRYWEQFGGLVSKVTEVVGGFSIEQSFTALGGYTNIRHADKTLASFFFQVGSPIRDADGRISLISSRDQDTESALRFYAEFANPNTSTYSWNKSLLEDRQKFLANELALYFAPASEARALRAGNPNLSIGTSAFPQLEGGDPVVYGSTYLLGVPRDARNIVATQTAALAFINTSVAQAFSAATGIAPVRRDLIANPPADPVQALAYEEAFIARGWLSPQPPKVDSAFSAMVEDVVSGRFDTEEALSRAERALR